MIYYDLHTHKRNIDPQVISVQNLRIGKDDLKECCVDYMQRYYSIGIHPWDIQPLLLSEQFSTLNEFAKYPFVLCVGEAGLDKSIEIPLELQKKVFEQQIQCSEINEKPLIIHCVKAWSELIALKKQIKPKQPWIIHGFRGGRILSEQLLDQGFFLSFNSKFNSDAIHLGMLNELFLETDELLKPIQELYEEVAAHLNITKRSLQTTLTNNFNALFK